MAWFEADTVPERERPQGFDPIPEGEYTVMISRTEDKETKNGRMLSVGMEVVDGQHKGRWIFENLNYQNKSAVAQLIAEQTLKDICNEIGRPVLKTHEELKGIPFKIKVKVKHNDYTDKLENVMSYVVTKKEKKAKAPEPVMAEESVPDDDIPF